MCRPVYLWFRFFFADNFIYDSTKMKIRAFMVGIPLFQILTLEFFFFQILKADEKSSIRWVIYPLFVMLILCYYRATYALPFAIPPYQYQQVPRNQWCHACNNWQPERAEHCPMCNKWVLKFHTHFPCIANCVGYHNEKFFYLYVIYSYIMNLVFIQYWARFWFGNNDYDVFIVFSILYWLQTMFILVMTLMFFGLIINFSLCFWNNLTMLGKYYLNNPIDRLQGKRFNLPLCPKSLENSDLIESNRNIYDRLWLQNITDLLCKNIQRLY